MEDKGKLIDEEFTEQEMDVLHRFVDTGNKRGSYWAVFGEEHKSQPSIYRWFNKFNVQAKILELGKDLAVYDTVCDKVLINIITDTNAMNRDKIAAIKTWNDLRDRVHTTIKLESKTKLDLSNVSTENLGTIVDAILKGKNNDESGTEDTDN